MTLQDVRRVPLLVPDKTPYQITYDFYSILRTEVLEGNPFLSSREQQKLQSHYPGMLDAAHHPPNLAATIYANRRSPIVKAIMNRDQPIVFDAGCGFGSESYLFAALGADVLAVDLSPERIEIAHKRQNYYQECSEQPLNITFVAADLNDYVPEKRGLSLTWLASVLAAIPNQDGFLSRVYDATRPGGAVVITDMNLLNPLFLLNEWNRRRHAKSLSPEFARHADFLAMVRRARRTGARYFPLVSGGEMDDVQFFSVKTLSRLMRKIGFRALRTLYSGVVPPRFYQPSLMWLESGINYIPLIRSLAYFYLISGRKAD